MACRSSRLGLLNAASSASICLDASCRSVRTDDYYDISISMAACERRRARRHSSMQAAVLGIFAGGLWAPDVNAIMRIWAARWAGRCHIRCHDARQACSWMLASTSGINAGNRLSSSGIAPEALRSAAPRQAIIVIGDSLPWLMPSCE